MLNSCNFMGRLTAAPELKTTPNGVSVTKFTIAVDRPFQTAGAERVADFIDCVAWRNTAEFICRYFHKGSMICVQGYMTTRTYTDKNNINRKAVELVTEHAHFTGEKREDAAAQSEWKPAPKPPAATPSATPGYSSGTAKDFQPTVYDEDDLPF